MRRIFEKFSVYLSERDRGRLLALLAAVFVVYLPFLSNPYIFDDVTILSASFTNHYSHSWFMFDFRWLPNSSLDWTTRIFTDAFPHPYRIGNVLLHAANVVILFYLLRLLLGAVLREQSRSLSVNWGAWLGAVVFALHPVAVYAVGYIMQRSILMATLFALLTQWAYLRALLSGQTRWLVLAVLAYFLACFSKEHCVMLPAVLLSMTLLLRKESRLSRREFWSVWCAFVSVAVLVVLVSKGVLGAAYEPMGAEMFEQQKIVASGLELQLMSVLTQAGLFFKYLLLWLVPDPGWMSVDMREPFVSSMSAWQGWVGMTGFVLYGLVALRLLLCGGVQGLAGLALLYPWLQFFVEFSTIRVQEPFVLYRSYLWMPGMMLFFPLLLIWFPQRRTMLILGCLTILLVPLAWNRLWVFGDNYRLWNDAALLLKNEHEAGADRIYYNRGAAEMVMQKWNDAANDFERTVAINPQLAPVHSMLGAAYINSGRFQEALEQYDAAIAIRPEDNQEYFGKGVTLQRLHRDKEALQQMEQSCKLNNTAACVIVWMSKHARN